MNAWSSYKFGTCGRGDTDDVWNRLVDMKGRDGDDANDDDTDVSNDDDDGDDVLVDDADESMKASITALRSSVRLSSWRSIATELIASLTRRPMLVVSSRPFVRSTSPSLSVSPAADDDKSLEDFRRFFRFVGDCAPTYAGLASTSAAAAATANRSDRRGGGGVDE